MSFEKKNAAPLHPQFVQAEVVWGTILTGDCIYAQDWGCWCLVDYVKDDRMAVLTPSGNLYMRVYALRKVNILTGEVHAGEPTLYKAPAGRMTIKRTLS